uniref:Uncharacterized protein n=1 Tax=Romanomermis culicivorax TaxID=13658 RepID=A0A915HW79_ROMCU
FVRSNDLSLKTFSLSTLATGYFAGVDKIIILNKESQKFSDIWGTHTSLKQQYHPQNFQSLGTDLRMGEQATFSDFPPPYFSHFLSIPIRGSTSWCEIHGL